MQPEVFDSRALALLNRLASRKKDPTPPPGRPAAPSAADVALASPAARSALTAQMKTTGGVAISDRPGTLCNMLTQLKYLVAITFSSGTFAPFSTAHAPAPNPKAPQSPSTRALGAGPRPVTAGEQIRSVGSRRLACFLNITMLLSAIRI